MDKKPTVSVLDLLLRPELPDVRRELPEKRVEVKRLSRLGGGAGGVPPESPDL